MKYEVEWKSSAEAELTRIWLGSRLRTGVREAADSLDRHLEQHPLEVGESRAGSQRIAFEAPLAIYFRVNEANRKFEVLNV